jgi:hypothetical protein
VPILVCGVYGVVHADGRRGWDADIGEPIELPPERGADAIAGLTQEVARELERFIARRPEEWHVLRPFWLVDLSPGGGKGE